MDCRLGSLCRQMDGRLESQCKDTKNKSMAEKKNAISYESIMKDLKARKFAPVYVLMGDEPFYIDKICDYIAENVSSRRSGTSTRPCFSERIPRRCRWWISVRDIR